jgi:hypothetical protein
MLVVSVIIMMPKHPKIGPPTRLEMAAVDFAVDAENTNEIRVWGRGSSSAKTDDFGRRVGVVMNGCPYLTLL